MIDYSVIIRTTGNAHEKYQDLLISIDRLEPRPVEVIVVLPEGYALPDEQLGYETFCFSPKGMVIQRMTGIEKCRTRYALICDDDISFDKDFVQKLYEPLEKGIAEFSAGPLLSFLPPKGLNAALCTVMASAVPTVLHRKDRYVTVLKSTGYSYNRNIPTGEHEYFETQAAAWTCFFADIEVLRKLEFDQEIWLDAHGYSALDDQTMFYKACLMGYRTVIVSDAVYTHLDAKTSTRNNRPSFLYSSSFNRVVFWHRFIYSMEDSAVEKQLSSIAFKYRIGWMKLLYRMRVMRKRMTKENYGVFVQGYAEGLEYLKSEEYRNLPKIRKEETGVKNDRK